jgi:hypothetical protein
LVVVLCRNEGSGAAKWITFSLLNILTGRSGGFL